jgi:hypothetical protein
MCYACSDYVYEEACPDEFPGCQGECSGFSCMDCSGNTLHLNEFYMVHDHVWDSVISKAETRGMICIGCLELRLGRLLNAADFTDAPVNSGFVERSPRLIDRMTSEDN